MISDFTVITSFFEDCHKLKTGMAQDWQNTFLVTFCSSCPIKGS